MKLNADEVISKYEKYGFKYKESYSNRHYLTFTFKTGFFHNAEIVKLADTPIDTEKESADKIITNLRELGYSAKITEYSNLEDIENGLFHGFFDVENWRKRITLEYENYINDIMKTYPNTDSLKYEYINTPYSVIGSGNPPNNSIIENIIDKLKIDGAQLILIEAPAGFGKTSTSYELLNKLSSDNSMPMPFFTEFSRDRQAKIFSHVFVREVDRTFSQVNSKLVEEELKNGRIIMILDGFDELLSDTNKPSDVNNNYENAEPMLETIGELLSNKAKIIITSRRSAMFDEYIFQEWLDRFDDRFKFIRYRIDPPEINDWLSYERKIRLEDIGISINSMANPVLLSYLRFLNIEKFNDLCEKPDEIVNQYFNSMLEREQERQNLLIDPEKQNKLLTLLAADMCEKNYTSDHKENIISLLKEKGLSILEEARKLYKPSDRPTLDSLCNIFSNHAFFNRSNQDDSRLEFINEFVFGNYIAEDILNYKGEWISSDELFVEPAVVSYLPRTEERKNLLWDSLKTINEFLDISIRMKFEFNLLKNISWNRYNKESIHSIDLFNLNMFDNCNLDEIAFYNCSFTSVILNIENLKKATFINCNFYDCEKNGSNKNILFLNCFSNNKLVEKIEDVDNDIVSNDDRIAIFILSKFWKVGSDNIERIHIPLSSIFKSSQQQKYNRHDIVKKIKSLKRMNILSDANDGGYISLNTQEISTIKDILGR